MRLASDGATIGTIQEMILATDLDLKGQHLFHLVSTQQENARRSEGSWMAEDTASRIL